MLEEIRELLKAKRAELAAIVKTAEDEKRTAFTEDETVKFDEIRAEIDKLVKDEERAVAAEESRKAVKAEVRTVAVVNEPNPVYRRDNASVSFFRDLASASRPGFMGAGEARERLVKAQETRADITPSGTTTAANGGTFAPPAWLVSEFVNLARPGRVTADLLNKMELPSGVSSVNLPTLTTGTVIGQQATQGAAVATQAIVTSSVSSGIATLAGRSIISMQLLEQSGIAFDQVILQDLARAYAGQANTGVLYGLTGVGASLSSVATTSVTVATTGVAALYTAVTKAVAGIQTAIFESPDALVMHPRRWAAIIGSSDSNGRPLVVPQGPAFNQAGTGDQSQAQGYVGTFAGLPTYVDSLIVTNLGASTNQDEIYLMKRSEHWLWESALSLASFDATYADNLSVLYRAHGFQSQIFNRRTGTVAAIRGTGLVAP